jgi:hypothetical protein
MRATGLIQSWNGNPLEVGPLYPFAGYEWVTLILCVAFCLLWTFWQMRSENAAYEEEVAQLRSGDRLAKALEESRK